VGSDQEPKGCGDTGREGPRKSHGNLGEGGANFKRRHPGERGDCPHSLTTTTMRRRAAPMGQRKTETIKREIKKKSSSATLRGYRSLKKPVARCSRKGKNEHAAPGVNAERGGGSPNFPPKTKGKKG